MVGTRSTAGIKHQDSPASPSDAVAASASGIETTVSTSIVAPTLTSQTAATLTTDLDATLRPQVGATPLHGTTSSKAPSTKASSTKSRRRELLRVKEELLKKEADLLRKEAEILRKDKELAALRVALNEDSEEEEEEERSTVRNHERTESWVNGQRAMPAVMPELHNSTPTEPVPNQQRGQVRHFAPTQARANFTVPNASRYQQTRRAPEPHVIHQEPGTNTHQEAAHNPEGGEPRCPAAAPSVFDYRELANAMALAARSMQPVNAPRLGPELPIFNGASSEWLPFKVAYFESAHYLSEQENLARLRRCLKGPAREAVQCLFVGATTSAEVLRLLAARFGRPDAICRAELEKLRHLPRLSENPRDVCTFASKVTNIVATVKALGKFFYLHNADHVDHVLEKLPPAMRSEFYNYVAEQPDDMPDLLLLTAFLERKADRCSRFATAEVIAPSDRREPANTQLTKKAARTYHVEAPATAQPPSSGKCPICNREDHRAKDCATMKKVEPPARWELTKKHKLCFRCLRTRKSHHTCKSKKCPVDGCKYTHHPLLHDPTYVPPVATTAHAQEVDTIQSEPEEVIVASARRNGGNAALLKILPVRVSGPLGTRDTYALLDDGSTCTLIETTVAEAIGAKGTPSPFVMEGVAGTKIDVTSSRRVVFNICGRNGGEPIEISARTMDSLRLSPQTVPTGVIESCTHLSDLRDNLLVQHATPTVLVGQDNWCLLLAHEMRRGKRSQPVASLTDLGWVLHGVYASERKSTHRINHVQALPNNDAIETLMREHFAMECLGVEKKRPHTEEEQRALDMLNKHTRQLPAGGYETGLLWRSDHPSPPENRHTALKRLELVEKKLDRQPEVKRQYEAQLQNLIGQGYAEEAPADIHPTKRWYLPHFGVTHPEKPGKLRIVHDAAAKTNGVSLNSLLLSGPDLLQSLPGVLMRFRQHPVAVTGDIKDMFLRVAVREEDRDAQRFLWRGDRRTGPPSEYRMKSVIFGATSSPCTAIFVKDQNAEKFKLQYPEAARAVIANHYMDDYLASFATEAQAIKVSREVDLIHKNANFHLDKWMSSSHQVLSELSPERQKEGQRLELDPTKVLGLVWDPEKDTLTFNVNERRIDGAVLRGERTPTKREALRAVMSIFDPLGLATPVTVQAKRILQDAWRSGIEWDEPLRDAEAAAWKSWGENVFYLPRLAIPRPYASYSTAQDRELHTFVDASSTAYAAAVYWRITDQLGQAHISLVAGKARVAPVGKVVSIPRLELQAAVLGVRLAETAMREHDLRPTRRVFWTDSATVLAWLRRGAHAYKPFVAHRIAEVHESTKINDWRWVPTKENVADDATRDSPGGFDTNHRWFRGPAFLSATPDKWPQEKTHAPPSAEAAEEERVSIARSAPETSLYEALPKIDKFSNWQKVIRTTARVLLFLDRLRARRAQATTCAITRKRTSKGADSDPTWGASKRKTPLRGDRTIVAGHSSGDQIRIGQVAPSVIPVQYLFAAELLWVKAQQQELFGADIAHLRRGEPIPAASRVHKLATYLDKEGVLRLRSRIAATAGLSRDQKEPAILGGEHPWVRLYIEWTHRQLHHGGFELTANEVRQHYWVLRLRQAVRGKLKECLICKIRKATPTCPSTGNHPPSRLAHGKRPFSFTGLDYFGPMSVTVGRSRQKRYGVLFTCLTTRAVHLELAGSLSTDSAIMALRRFIGRRGCPTEIVSDNGTNFKGANAELLAAAQGSMEAAAGARAIRWRYIPPSAPFMGGAWERLVRSVKVALQTTLHERAPREEVLATLLVEAEHTLNCRPLTHVSMEPDEPEALTPNHFLLGGPSRVPMPGAFTEGDAAGRKEWRASQLLADRFWARWVREYLPELQHRREPHATGPPIKIGDQVLIADGTLPRNCWPRGVVVAAYPGGDQEIRVVDVKTQGRVMRRPTKRLIVLPG